MTLGRPRKLHHPHPDGTSGTISDGIINDLTAGLFKADAAARAGIARSTLNNWLDRGAHLQTRIDAFDTEHPDALDCTHTWNKARTPRCTTCGTAQTTWTDLETHHERDADYLQFLDACTRAQAEAKLRVVARVREALEPRMPEVLRNPDGTPLVVNGRVQTVRPVRGDWRAGAWWLERADPTQYHLPTKVELAGDPDGAPIEVSVRDLLDGELSELAVRMDAADAARDRAMRGGQDAAGGEPQDG